MPETAKEQPLTATGLLKWGGAIAAITTSVISIVWFSAMTRAELTANSDHDTRQDTEIRQLKDRDDAKDKRLAELERKMDVALAILQRIEQKTDRAAKP